MVTIRLSRHGAKKHPFYHIVVTESESARDGRFIEHIGLYDPAKPAAKATIDRARLDHWIGVGAQVSETLAKVLREQKKSAAAS
jgi:small subunit ribosomal protein S16